MKEESRMANIAAAHTWLLWALLSAVFAALTAIFAKIGVGGISADLATFFRTVIILAVLGTILAATRQFRPLAEISLKTWVFLILSGLATGASWVCYFRALKMGDAARVAPIDKLSVVIVALISVALLGEHLSGRNWIGIGLISAGAVLVALR